MTSDHNAIEAALRRGGAEPAGPGTGASAKGRQAAQRLARRIAEEGLADVSYGPAESPFGTLLLATTRRGLVRLAFPEESMDHMLERARAQDNIEFLPPYVVQQFVAGENGALGHATLKHVETGELRELEVSGAFIAIGHEPQSGLVRGQVDVDDNDYVLTDGASTRTNRPGVFAAGDLVDHTYRQAITAAGTGCQAALDAEWYLRDTPEVPTPEGMPEGDLAEAQYAPLSRPQRV